MISNLTNLGYRVIRNDEENLTHVSGHATRTDMAKLIEVTSPQIYVPVHGEAHHLEGAQELANQLNVPEIARLNRLGEAISFGDNVSTSIYREFEHHKISTQKTFNLTFVQSLKQKTR